MKYIMVLLITIFVTGCGTIGGAVDGAGDDLNAAGKYIKEIGKEDVTLFGKDIR